MGAGLGSSVLGTGSGAGAGLGDSTTGWGASGVAVASGGIGGLYPLAGLCFWRITQQDELFALWGVEDALADFAVLCELSLLL